LLTIDELIGLTNQSEAARPASLLERAGRSLHSRTLAPEKARRLRTEAWHGRGR